MLPLLYTCRPAVTFPAAEHRRPLASTQIILLGDGVCEQLAQGCYVKVERPRHLDCKSHHDSSPSAFSNEQICKLRGLKRTIFDRQSARRVVMASDSPLRGRGFHYRSFHFM